MKEKLLILKQWLQGLSFRTGATLLALSVLCYIISFAQAALPFSLGVKGALWFIFFGLAKTFQYSGILIVGKEGILRIKKYFQKPYKKWTDQ